MKIKKLMTHVFTRLFLFGLALVAQIAWLIYTAYAFSDTYKIVNVLLTFLSLLAVFDFRRQSAETKAGAGDKPGAHPLFVLCPRLHPNHAPTERR